MDTADDQKISRKNPRAQSGSLAAVTFAWTFGIFRRGFRRDLELTDLCEPLPEHTANLLGDKLEELWNKELAAHKDNPKKGPSLLRVILKAFGGQILLYMVAVYVTQFVVKLGQPLLLSQLLKYFAPNSEVTLDQAKLYAGGVLLCIFGSVMTIHPFIMANTHLGMKIRIATCSLIYRKCLRLSKEATLKKGTGHLINILSNDASRFDMSLLFVPEALLGPLITGVVAYLIWVEAGWLAVVGVAILVMFVPLQAILAKMSARFTHKIAAKTDNRIRLMGEIVSGIQVIKMYAWEESFAKLVAHARKKEVDIIRRKAFTLGTLSSFCAFAIKLSLFASLLAYASHSDAIQANVVFAIVLCYAIIEDNLFGYFTSAISCVSEAYVSVRRMEAFLMNDEATEATIQRTATNVDPGEIMIKDLSAKWSSEDAENTLDHLNVNIKPGSLVGVIGAVGSGKSSFLQLILREIPVASGTIDVGGTVSYASQEPWLFNETVCQNILFGLPMDREKYDRVVRVCALEPDFKQLPYGDKSIIGDRGVCLSGGQKARVNLARAVYRDADIYVLDDPLSAVDFHVGRHLFEKCISGYLAGKTVVLATHHVQRLTTVGHIIKVDSGKVVAEGSFQELCDIGVDLLPLENCETSETEEKEDLLKSQPDVSSKDAPKQTEMKSTGRVSASVYLAYLNAVKSIPLLVCVMVTFILVIVATSGSDYWVSFWVNKEEYGFPVINIPLLGKLDREMCMIIYGILIGSIIFSALLRTILYCVMVMRASTNLHDKMFRTVSYATMRFFNTTPSGQILNRFSRDVGVMDSTLQNTIQECVKVAFMILGSLAIIFIVNWYLMLPFIVVVIVLYTLRQYYVATSRSIKRLESVARSPIYTYASASLQGLATIRAMRAQSQLHKEFEERLDTHSSAWHYRLGTNRAFGYYLDLTCCVYISFVTFSFLVFDNHFLGGDVGLAITQSIGLTFLFTWCLRQSAEMENQMTSVERVCEFGKVESEGRQLGLTPEKKLDKWPSRGVIQFSAVSLSYDTNQPAVLKNISFDIRAGEKVGIVGRTGAGKSSLVAALFRLHKIEGKIIIDGIDTSLVGLQDLRSNISIIPQDPVIFSGTIRFNLDPFEEYNDTDLWNALEEVELKSIVQDSLQGLQMNLSEGGANLSVGQRQLVCLARAILRNSTVLVLDEATANVDAETDDVIQKAIRKRFVHCTVITIAHRLNTIMDSDRILVMDNGEVAEFGPPQDLLRNPKGHFTHLVELAGPKSVTVQETLQ